MSKGMKKLAAGAETAKEASHNANDYCQLGDTLSCLKPKRAGGGVVAEPPLTSIGQNEKSSPLTDQEGMAPTYQGP